MGVCTNETGWLCVCTNETYGQPVSSLVESILDGVAIKFVASGEIDVDLDSSLNSLNPLSPPYVSVIALCK